MLASSRLVYHISSSIVRSRAHGLEWGHRILALVLMAATSIIMIIPILVSSPLADLARERREGIREDYLQCILCNLSHGGRFDCERYLAYTTGTSI